MPLTLIQIPISHNCAKVRCALERKGLAYDTVDVHPMDRSPVRRASGQALVPVLMDGGQAIPDSTAILLHLEERHPEVPLIPADPAGRAACLVLEDWADASLMALSRRLAYWQVLQDPDALAGIWEPGGRGLRRWLRGRVGRRAVRLRFRLSERQNRRDQAEARRVAALAVARLAGRPVLVGEAVTIADLALATMAAPLWAASPAVTGDDAVRRLLEWAATILESAELDLYRPRG
jgi:glutathione S-transferase